MVESTKTHGQFSPSSTVSVGDSPIARLCVQNGLKMTGQRRVIAYVLSEAEDHPDVEELYRRASALDSRISVATVYRTVRLLEEKGILERRDFGGGRARYEASENGHHYHLIDIDTGRVIEFENDEPARLLARIAVSLGFDCVSHHIEIFGRKRESQSHISGHASGVTSSGFMSSGHVPSGQTEKEQIEKDDNGVISEKIEEERDLS